MNVKDILDLAVSCGLFSEEQLDKELQAKVLHFAGVCYAEGLHKHQKSQYFTAKEVMDECGWTFCANNKEATQKETEFCIEYVLKQFAELENECLEQARLLGMSAGREQKLVTRIRELERLVDVGGEPYV